MGSAQHVIMIIYNPHVEPVTVERFANRGVFISLTFWYVCLSVTQLRMNGPILMRFLFESWRDRFGACYYINYKDLFSRFIIIISSFLTYKVTRNY